MTEDRPPLRVAEPMATQVEIPEYRSLAPTSVVALVLGLRGLGFDPAGGLSMAILIRARDLLLGGVGLWQLAR